jgi:hypothetical protein
VIRAFYVVLLNSTINLKSYIYVVVFEVLTEVVLAYNAV